MQVKMSHKTELPRGRDGEMGHVTCPRCSVFSRNFPGIRSPHSTHVTCNLVGYDIHMKREGMLVGKVIPQYCIAHPYCARFQRH